ncbi:hypothetical protein pdam_00025468, partial [Pocillopora damicornis]
NDKETDSNESNTGVSEQSELCSSWREKRKGRRIIWEKRCVNNLDAICTSVYCNKKLIFTYTKNLKNAEIHADVLKELDQKYEDGSFPFSIDHLKNKFKICISECKKIALTVETSTGRKVVQDEKQLEEWFNQLFPLVQTRYSCNPHMAAKSSLSLQLSDGEQQRNCHICSISSTFSLKAFSFLGNGLHYHNHAAVPTGTEIEWHCESCAEEWSRISREPIAASSTLENFDSLSTSSEPLHPPTTEVSWGPHLGQFLQEQFEGSTIDGTINHFEDAIEDPTNHECLVGEFPVTYR